MELESSLKESTIYLPIAGDISYPQWKHSQNSAVKIPFQTKNSANEISYIPNWKEFKSHLLNSQTTSFHPETRKDIDKEVKRFAKQLIPALKESVKPVEENAANQPNNKKFYSIKK
ncbi:hypothetical protein AVEN_103278-1 [Araneus ventricosus]|uniref:Uncharacterized protein n=1 Tax=Araneus ventricosus TaxID=182803 RepID=A0A4Y2RZT4_ARAVE|nr:hypothetical protein AVEN_103278-1 [Araneus ventricosus]